jgi:hypothetical protein
LEKYLRNTEGRASADGDRHQLPVLREIVDLTTIGAPARFISAMSGDRPSAVGPWERLDVDFQNVLGGNSAGKEIAETARFVASLAPE